MGYAGVAVRNNNKIWFIVRDYAGDAQTIMSAGNYTINQWYHVVGVYNGTDLVIFVNGVEENREAFTGTLGTSTDVLTIGYQEQNSRYYFNGTIDEVMIFNRSLNSSEIQALYNNQSSGLQAFTDDPALVGYWTFNDTSYEVEDESGNGNKGELNGFDVYDLSDDGNDGISYGATWNESGRWGGAFEFDGVDDYVDVGNDSSLNPTNGITISAWVKIDDDTNVKEIVTKGAWDTGYELRIGVNEDVQMFINGSLDTKGTLTVGKWHHVVGTFNGTDVTAWLDGVSSGSPTAYSGEIPIINDNECLR